MPPRALNQKPRPATLPAVRTPVASSLAIKPRQAQVLQSSRAPAQLSLFLRPSGAR